MTRHRKHWCAAPGCRVLLGRRSWVMCTDHWALVPDYLRRRITDQYVPGQYRQSILYTSAVRQAVDAVADHLRGAA